MKQVKYYFYSCIALMSLTFLSFALIANENKKILMVVSGYGEQQGQM